MFQPGLKGKTEVRHGMKATRRLFSTGYALSEEEFNELVERHYPGAFGEAIPEQQRLAQKYGMYFSSSRTVSVLSLIHI